MDELYAWVVPEQDGEPPMVIAWSFADGGVRPLISHHRDRALKIEILARMVARGRRQNAELVRFTRAETITVISGDT